MATANIRFNILLKQQQKKQPKKPTAVVIHFEKGHSSKIRIVARKNLKKRRELYQVVWKLLKDTICDIQGQHPPPVMKALRKSERKTAELDNRVKEVVTKK